MSNIFSSVRNDIRLVSVSSLMAVLGALPACTPDESDAKKGDSGQDANGGASGAPDCSELSIAACLDEQKNEDGRCTVVVATEIEGDKNSGYCYGAEHKYCVDVEGANCGDTDAEADWTDSDGAIYRTPTGCGLDHFERIAPVTVSNSCDDSGQDANGGASGAPDCSELSIAACLDEQKKDDDRCIVVVATEIEGDKNSGYCYGAEHKYCVDVEGTNCGDTDAEADWTDSDGAIYRTSTGCGPDHFERINLMGQQVDRSESCP